MATQTHYARGPWPEAAGYQALGNLMGGYPEMAIFRRFRNAGALDLLYRQADLQCTIHDWALTAEADQQTQGPGRRNDPLRHEYDRVFDELRRSVDADEPGARTQWRRWRQVSEKLKDYRKSLIPKRLLHLFYTLDC